MMRFLKLFSAKRLQEILFNLFLGRLHQRLKILLRRHLILRPWSLHLFLLRRILNKWIFNFLFNQDWKTLFDIFLLLFDVLLRFDLFNNFVRRWRLLINLFGHYLLRFNILRLRFCFFPCLYVQWLQFLLNFVPQIVFCLERFILLGCGWFLLKFRFIYFFYLYIFDWFWLFHINFLFRWRLFRLYGFLDRRVIRKFLSIEPKQFRSPKRLF